MRVSQHCSYGTHIPPPHLPHADRTRMHKNGWHSPLAPSLAGARVLELGAGMSGLAGLGVAACSDALDVVITDGNPESVQNLEVEINVNSISCRERARAGGGGLPVTSRILGANVHHNVGACCYTFIIPLCYSSLGQR